MDASNAFIVVMKLCVTVGGGDRWPRWMETRWKWDIFHTGKTRLPRLLTFVSLHGLLAVSVHSLSPMMHVDVRCGESSAYVSAKAEC